MHPRVCLTDLTYRRVWAGFFTRCAGIQSSSMVVPFGRVSTRPINRYPDLKLTVILLTNLFRAGANDLGHEIASFYEPDFRSLAYRNPRADPKPERTATLRKMIDAVRVASRGVRGVSKNFPYRFYVESDWSDLLEGATEFTFLGCDSLAGRKQPILAMTMSETCYYRLSENPRRFVSFLFDKSGKVAWINPYEY